MKTNLDTLFKTDSKAEKEGIWFEISDTAAFKVRRFGGQNSPRVKAALALKYKPFTRQIEAGTMPQERELKIFAEVFIDSSVVDWRGIEIDGKEVEFSKEKCLELFTSMPDLFDAIHKYASDLSTYKEQLGNS